MENDQSCDSFNLENGANTLNLLNFRNLDINLTSSRDKTFKINKFEKLSKNLVKYLITNFLEPFEISRLWLQNNHRISIILKELKM